MSTRGGCCACASWSWSAVPLATIVALPPGVLCCCCCNSTACAAKPYTPGPYTGAKPYSGACCWRAAGTAADGTTKGTMYRDACGYDGSTNADNAAGTCTCPTSTPAHNPAGWVVPSIGCWDKCAALKLCSSFAVMLQPVCSRCRGRTQIHNRVYIIAPTACLYWLCSASGLPC